jgi:hypothetical protein
MRGKDEQKLDVFSYVSPEHRVPKDYPFAWALGSGLWALGSGLWALGSGLWERKHEAVTLNN